MLPRGLGTSTNDSFNGSFSNRRPVSPLTTPSEANERAHLHEELEKKATAAFTSSKELVDKLDAMHNAANTFGKWSLTAEVETKLNTFKVALSRDDDGTHQNLWDLIQADLIISSQQAKMNEMMVKTNADLKLQLAFARETVHRKQEEALDSLNSVVADCLSLLKTRQEEAFRWKMSHHEQVEASQSLGKELKQLGKRFEEANTKIGQLESDKAALEVDLEQARNEGDVQAAAVQKLSDLVQELQKKNREQQMQLDQKTDELASIDCDLRKAAEDMSNLKARNKVELERYTEAFQKKLDGDLRALETDLKNEHQSVVEQLQAQIARLENDRDMLNGRLDEAKSHIGHVEQENDYLKRNAKKIKQDLISQCQRRVFSALNYDTQSSDSSPPERPQERGRLPSQVHFNHDVPRASSRTRYEEDRSAASNHYQMPVQQPQAAAAQRPQAAQRAPPPAAPQKVSLSSVPGKRKPPGFIRRPQN